MLLQLKLEIQYLIMKLSVEQQLTSLTVWYDASSEVNVASKIL
jgi:hypothetical protein